MRVEIHPALAQEGGRWLFTVAAWRDGLRPLPGVPGLWVPAAVDHALYIVHHAVIHHELEMGLQGAADLWFLTADWGEGIGRLARAADGAAMARRGLLGVTRGEMRRRRRSDAAVAKGVGPQGALDARAGMAGGGRRGRAQPRRWSRAGERRGDLRRGAGT